MWNEVHKRQPLNHLPAALLSCKTFMKGFGILYSQYTTEDLRLVQLRECLRGVMNNFVRGWRLAFSSSYLHVHVPCNVEYLYAIYLHINYFLPFLKSSISKVSGRNPVLKKAAGNPDLDKVHIWNQWRFQLGIPSKYKIGPGCSSRGFHSCCQQNQLFPHMGKMVKDVAVNNLF